MKRYTHKLNESEGNCNYFLIPDKEECDNAENKLGQLEDILDGHNIETLEELDNLLSYVKQIKTIEEEIGIDLVTLFKAFNCIWYKKGNELKVSCHIALIDWAIYVLEESMTIGDGICLHFQEYGKTWALTKEELL